MDKSRNCTRVDRFQIGQAQMAIFVGQTQNVQLSKTMVSGHQACTFEIGTDIFQQNTKCKVHAAPSSFWSVFPTAIFEIGTDIFSTDLESVMVWSQSTDFKSVLWAVLTDLKSVAFGATPPNRLRIGHPQIVSYSFNRIQIGQGVWGGQISKLHGMTDFKSVRSAN